MTEVNLQTAAWPISEALRTILYDAIREKSGACIVTFRDPTYSPNTGGFHPVEVLIGSDGNVEYITDFTYIGTPPYAELIKEIDFDFATGEFYLMGRELPLPSGRGLFNIWQENFCSYHRMGVYQMTVEEIN